MRKVRKKKKEVDENKEKVNFSDQLQDWISWFEFFYNTWNK